MKGLWYSPSILSPRGACTSCCRALSDKMLDDLASYVTYINYNQKLLDEQIVWSIHGRNMKVLAGTIKKGRDLKEDEKTWDGWGDWELCGLG